MVDEPSLFRRYLLGALEESAQEDFERNLMTSDEHFQELLIAEDELVDDYWSGKLSASDVERYRERFLVTDERRHQHRFGAALRKYLQQTAWRRRAPRRAWVALAAGVAVLLAAALWSILRAPVRFEETAQRVEGSRVAFFLTAGRLRSLPPETEQAVTVPGDVALVELQLDLPGDAPGSYDVRLEEVETDTILAEGRLTARTIEGEWVVVAAVPSELLAPGDYRVTLRAASPTDGDAVPRTYEFRVQRE
jgi:hypothetical protein